MPQDSWPAGFKRQKSLKKISLPSSQHQFEQSTCISHSSLKAFGFPVFHAATPRRCSFCPKDFERVRCSLACKCERKQFSNLLASSIQQGQMACICAACKDLFIYIPDMGRQCCFFFQISIFIYIYIIQYLSICYIYIYISVFKVSFRFLKLSVSKGIFRFLQLYRYAREIFGFEAIGFKGKFPVFPPIGSKGNFRFLKLSVSKGNFRSFHQSVLREILGFSSYRFLREISGLSTNRF